MKLTGTPVFRARRIEAGLLSAGRDFNKSTTPFDVGLNKFVDMQKGNFIGKQALDYGFASQRRHRLSRK